MLHKGILETFKFDRLKTMMTQTDDTDPPCTSEESRLLHDTDNHSVSVQSKYTDTVDESVHVGKTREFSEKRVVAAIAIFTFFSSFSDGSGNSNSKVNFVLTVNKLLETWVRFVKA